MASNPNPSKITDEMWWLWERCLSFIPGVQLGGIYANKSGYHNTVTANQQSWPGSYSVKLPLDLEYNPKDKARGIDLTMSTSEMIKRTKLLKAAADHPQDSRLFGLREFIGTLDGVNVFCYIRDTDSGPWRFDGSRDSSHLWHIHISFWTKYCAVMDAMLAVASVLEGVTWEQWQAKESDDVAVRVRITSSDPEWNGKFLVGGTFGRFEIRQPKEIRNALASLYPTLIDYNDASRGVTSTDAGYTWDSFLDGVFGEDLTERTANLDARFAAIQASIDAIAVPPPGNGTPPVEQEHTHTATLQLILGPSEPLPDDEE